VRTEAADGEVAMKERELAADLSALAQITTGGIFRDICYANMPF